MSRSRPSRFRASGVFLATAVLAVAMQHSNAAGAPRVSTPSGPLRGRYMGVGSIMNQTCSEVRSFVYYEPAGQGPFPIAVYLPGTMTAHDDPIFLMYLRRLADKGYVAVSVDYGQFAILCSFGCSCYKPRTDCLFNPEPEDSLISAIASQTRGDPSLGIVVWGHSQGGYMALMSGDLNRNVRRVVATGASDCAGYYSCIQPGSRGLPSDAIRVVIGEHDHTAKPRQADDRGSTPGFRQQLTALTEQPAKCNAPGNFSCFRPNGSGFYIVQDSETAEKHADHRFWQKGEQAAGNRIDSLEAGYVKDSWRPWSLDATIDWLTGACGNRTCDPTESARTCALDCGGSR